MELTRLQAANKQMGDYAARLEARELAWRDRQQFLAARGYMLRPRYHPGWVPSWSASLDINPFRCEDFIALPFFPHIIDATRISDGRLVCIKRVARQGQELELTRYFSSPELRADPRNHSIPILDSFDDDVDERLSYIVMPFYRPMTDPPFDLVNDIVEFADQVLEGLAFIHAHDVAHRDVAETNILMDADVLYPHGFHPAATDKLPDAIRNAWPYTRFSAPSSVRYYFADFGLSVRIPPEAPRLVTGYIGADRDAPELSDDVPYDPFKVDIYVLGNVFRHHISEKYFRVEFLGPLIAAMTHKDPQARPTAQAALHQWRQIRRRVFALHRVCRLRDRDETIIQTLVLDVISILKVVYVLSRRFAGWSLSWLLLVFS